MTELTSQQRFDRAFRHNATPDRVPMFDMYWPDTFAEWHRQGLPEGFDLFEEFGLDVLGISWIDASLGLPAEQLEESDEWVIWRDGNGVVVKVWKTSSATPSRLDCYVKDWDTWLEVKDRLQPSPDRISQAIRDGWQSVTERSGYQCYTFAEPCWWFLEDIMSFERALPLMVEQPDLVNDIIGTATDFGLSMAEVMIAEGLPCDALWFFSDLCYKNGMLFSPKTYRELLMPHHKRIKEWCLAHDWQLILHCDGYVGELLPLLLEVGFDAIQPLEARCGNDVRTYKRLYGTDIAFFGNISADVMATGRRDEIEEEVKSKLEIAKEGGGYIYHSDHSIPRTVTLDDYRFTLDCVKRYGKY